MKETMSQYLTRNRIIGLAVIAYGVIALQNGWVCDDAYITLRTIDNIVRGHGPTWNIFERVQTYTHPLWMLLVACFYYVTREAFYTTLFVSLACSIAAVALFAFRVTIGWFGAIFAVIALTLSKAFIDFSTSGLENPLTFLLLVLFMIVYFGRAWNIRNLAILSVIAFLAAFNRIDSFVLLAPALLFYSWRLRSIAAVGALVAGSIPFLIWEAFSFIYYGFLVPNTAYAKLNTGLPEEEMWAQGLLYFENSLKYDPLTLTIIAVAIVVVLVRRTWSHLPLIVGILLYFLYIIKIGGCFMSGRYFAAPLLIAIAVLARSELPWQSYLKPAALLAVLVLGLSAERCPVYTTSDYGFPDMKLREVLGAGLHTDNRITDERAFYFRTSSFLNSFDGKPMPSHEWADQGRDMGSLGGARSVIKSAIGCFGYFAGPFVHVIDHIALPDPLLARLPTSYPEHWGPGHYFRDLPLGYVETINQRRNMIVDTNLAAYYDKIAFVTQGRLLSLRRLKVAIELNLGLYDHYIDAYMVNVPQKPGNPYGP